MCDFFSPTVPHRADLRALYEYAVTAAHPGFALRRSLQLKPFPTPQPGGSYIVLAIGKAAVAMMEEALAHMPLNAVVVAVVVTNYENRSSLMGLSSQVRGYLASHPVPDAAGLVASAAVIEALSRSRAEDVVLVLLSGGGSALLPAPVPGISLDDKAEINRVLLKAGATIAELNLVRQSVSQLKGGGLAALARPAQIDTRIVSDVADDNPRVVASGPTYGPLGSAQDAKDILIRYGVLDSLPAAVRQHLERSVEPNVPAFCEDAADTHEMIASNRHSLDAMEEAARRMGCYVVRAATPLVGDVAEAAARIVAEMRPYLSSQRAVALLWGGETTVRVTGGGQGGRNQELALRVALAMAHENMPPHWAFMSAGTDGRDGPTNAAGAIVDGQTLARIADAGLDAGALLADNDSYTALAAAGDLMITNATGTNVADVQALVLPLPVGGVAPPHARVHERERV